MLYLSYKTDQLGVTKQTNWVLFFMQTFQYMAKKIIDCILNMYEKKINKNNTWMNYSLKSLNLSRRWMLDFINTRHSKFSELSWLLFGRMVIVHSTGAEDGRGVLNRMNTFCMDGYACSMFISEAGTLKYRSASISAIVWLLLVTGVSSTSKSKKLKKQDQR